MNSGSAVPAKSLDEKFVQNVRSMLSGKYHQCLACFDTMDVEKYRIPIGEIVRYIREHARKSNSVWPAGFFILTTQKLNKRPYLTNLARKKPTGNASSGHQSVCSSLG